MADLRLTYVNLGTDDPAGLARFYARLFGWRVDPADGEFQVVEDPAGGVGVSCQYEAHHVRPTWPAGADDQQMQLHLEVRVDDLAGAVQHALDCGATLAEFQPQDDVRVCLDPAGHPFCLYVE
jgi:catechol 2,3-dioxygenase-like lactoylglutathione lyase family enzyme